jgi:integrase/recombinase XerD
MSISKLSAGDCLSLLASHLATERYCCSVTKNYFAAVKRFLQYAEGIGLGIETVRRSDVEHYLSTLRLFRKLRSRPRRSPRWVRRLHRSALHMLLRVLDAHRPPPVSHGAARDLLHDRVVKEYDDWMSNLRGLSVITREDRRSEALRFLQWLEKRDGGVLADLAVADIDAYVRWRSVGVRRPTVKSITTKLRSFLRHLHLAGRTSRDLSTAVIGPTLYALEGIPSALRAVDVAKVLHMTRRDQMPIGRRDYAILALLSVYGMRAGEITNLRLEDIDWKRSRLHVRHSKTGATSELPLLRVPGDAILDYLRDGRPETTLREVFLRSRAPYRAFRCGSTLYTPIRRRLAAAGINPPGKKGPHAFRHARAVSLLRSSVSLKVIGDLLGHRSVDSTAAYLKLATEDLRNVALEIPAAVLS